MSFGGGGSGSGSIAGSTDVILNSPTNGQVLTYNTTLGKWQNAAGGSSAVSSVAGRTGAVVLTAADVSGVVTTTQINAASGVAGLDNNARVAIANLPISIPIVVSESSGAYPARPVFAGAVWWKGPDQPAGGGTTGGGAGAVNGLDVWFKTDS